MPSTATEAEACMAARDSKESIVIVHPYIMVSRVDTGKRFQALQRPALEMPELELLF